MSETAAFVGKPSGHGCWRPNTPASRKHEHLLHAKNAKSEAPKVKVQPIP